jgi:hypothetical protein
MGGGCGAGLMTMRHQGGSRGLEESSFEPLRDTLLFHKNNSNIENSRMGFDN